MQTAKNRLLALGLTLALTMGISTGISAAEVLPPQNTDMTGDIVIIHTNDSHGRIAENMTLAGIKALRDSYEKQGAAVLLFDAGDTLHGKPIINMSRGNSAVDMMNLVGYDAMVPGNHDFNYGSPRLVHLAKKMKFPLLAANVTKKETGKLMADDCVIFEKAGKKIGVFGLATPETLYKSSPKNTQGVTFADPIKTARTQVRALKAEGVDMIIALTHLGLDQESEVTSEKVARAVPGIDLIVDGHSHTLLEDGMQVGSTLIVSAKNYLEYAGVVVVDEKGNKTAGVVTPEQFSNQDATAENALVKLKTFVDNQLSDTVSRTSVMLDGERENVRTRETNLGNLIADSMQYATGAQISLFNGGGIRASIPAGAITNAQILEVLPFGNYVVVKKLSGKEVLEALEKGVGAYPEHSGGFPHVAGITFEIDPSAPAGSRVKNAMVGDAALKPNEFYTIAVNDFMAAGGDGYTMFEGKKEVSMHQNMEELVSQFINKHPAYVAAVDGRIIVKNQAKQAA